MSNVLAQAHIILTADTARFISEITNARNLSFNSFNDIKNSAKELAKIGMMGLAAGASAATGAIAAMTTEQVRLANELSKTARIANTTATEIQKYTFAAKAAGIEQDKLADIFKDTQDKVGDFLSTGGGELQDFFNNVAPQAHLTADELRRLSGPDALQAMYNAMDKANLSQSEMVFYMEGIADEASSLIPLLADGGAGFKLWADAAENAGAVMDEKTIRASQELRASTDLLKLSYQGVKNQLTQALIPVLGDLASSLVQDANLKNQAKAAGEGLASTFKVIAMTGVGVVAIVTSIGKAIGGAMAALAQFGRVAESVDLTSPFAMFQIGKNVLWNIPKAQLEILQGTAIDIGDTLSKADKTMTWISNLGTTGTNTRINQLVTINNAIDQQNKKLGQTGAQIQDNAKAEADAAKAREKSANATAKLGDKQLAVYSAWKKQGISDQWAKILTAEVGRENDYRATALFGYHRDRANGQINGGMLSWQKDRGKQLASYLASQGVLTGGKIQQSQASLDAMAKFAINEIMTNPAYARTKAAMLNNPNIDAKSGFAITGGNYIKWDMSGNAVLGAKGAAKHAAKRDNYYRQISAKAGLADSSNIVKDAEQDLRDTERLAKEQQDLQMRYITQFADDKTKLYIEHTNTETELAKINDVKLREQLLKSETTRYQNKLDLLQLEYDKQTQKATEWQQSDEDRIKANADLERREVGLTLTMSKELRTAQIESITAKEQQALREISDTYQKELDNITAYNRTELDVVRAEYQSNLSALDKRTDITDPQKSDLRNALAGKLNHDLAIIRKPAADAFNSLNAEMSSTTELLNLKNQLDQRLEIIKAYEANHTNVEVEAANARKAVNDDFANHQRAILVGGYQQTFGALGSIVSAFGGQQSKAYRVMAAVEKGYALYSAILSSKVALSKAWASAPFPDNLLAVGQVVLKNQEIVSAITSFAPKGFMDGGYTGNIPTNARAGYVHGQEYVFDAPSTKAIGVKNLDRIRKGESVGGDTNVNVNVTVNSDGTSSVESQQQLGKNIGDAVNAAVQKALLKERRQGGLLSGAR